MTTIEQALTEIYVGLNNNNHKIIRVESDAMLGMPSYSYSVGLTETGPNVEFAISGVDPETSSMVIAEVAKQVKEKGVAISDGVRVEGIIKDSPILFREIPEQAISEYLGVAEIVSENREWGQVKVYQVILPDETGKLPDDDGVQPEYVEFQSLFLGDDIEKKRVLH